MGDLVLLSSNTFRGEEQEGLATLIQIYGTSFTVLSGLPRCSSHVFAF